MYKVSIIVLCTAFSACLFTACRSGLQSDENSLVQVGDEILSRQELADAMPEGLSRADSTDFADKYIRRWICDVLLYRMAQKNIPDIGRIDALVEKYRRDLVIFEYRKRLLNERVTKSFDEQEMLDYYGALYLTGFPLIFRRMLSDFMNSTALAVMSTAI